MGVEPTTFLFLTVALYPASLLTIFEQGNHKILEKHLAFYFLLPKCCHGETTLKFHHAFADELFKLSLLSSNAKYLYELFAQYRKINHPQIA